jgi:hypothetical protein
MAIKFQLKRGTASNWSTSNPILAAGELGFETDTNKAKVGDGVTNWNSLSYFAGVSSSSNVFSSNVIIDVSTSDPALRVTQRGSGHSLLIEDETNPDSTPFVINSLGRVGIGTASPEANLDVISPVNSRVRAYSSATTGANIAFFTAQFGTGSTLEIRAGLGYTFLVSSNSGGGLAPPLLLGANGTEHMRITDTGRVGIGRSDPQFLLDANGTIRATDAIRVRGRSDANGYIQITSLPATGTNLTSAIENYRGTGVRVAYSSWFNGSTYYGAITEADIPIVWGTNSTERMILTGAGRIGVGTLSPLTNVHFKYTTTQDVGTFIENTSQAQFAGAGITGLTPAGGAGFYVYNKGASPTNGASAAISRWSNTGSYVSGIWTYDFPGNTHIFYTGLDSTERLRINSDGRVGIGTDTPGYKLEVSNTTGDVISAVVAKSAGASVFRLIAPDATYTAFNAIASNQSNAGQYEHWAIGGFGVANTLIFKTNGSVEGARIESNRTLRANANVTIPTGVLGIGATDAPSLSQAKLYVKSDDLGTSAGSNVRSVRINTTTGNANYLDISARRFLAGSDWTNTSIRIQKTVDATPQGFIDFGIDGVTADHGVGIGHGSTTLISLRSSSSRIGMGTSSPGEFLHVDAGSNEHIIQLSKTSSNNWVIGAAGPSSRRVYFKNKDSNQEILTITDTGRVGIANTAPPERLFISGNIAATGTITASYSDERLKEKLGNVNNSIEIIQSLNGFKYKNNDLAKTLGYESDSVQIGLSAQEVQKVLPEVVSLAPFDMARDEEDNLISKSGENYLTLDYAKLVPVLVEAVKELKSEIEKIKENK